MTIVNAYEDDYGFADDESQAIWCALYKQSPGDEGWQVCKNTIIAIIIIIMILLIKITTLMMITINQVLGMINNYQRDAGEEDDRDSGSLTLLASLAEGDQVSDLDHADNDSEVENNGDGDDGGGEEDERYSGS